MATIYKTKLNKIETLVGREEYTSQMIDAFKRASRGQRETILVPGHSGIGKTSLVNWLKKPVESENGIFVSGKFDQFQQNTPYYAIRTALNQLWEKISVLHSKQHFNVEEKIKKAVGELGFLLSELIPGMKDVLPVLSNANSADINFIEARHRFTNVIKTFLKTVCLPEHPVVIFIDDWQWADTASLDLLKEIQNDNTLDHFLLLASYRDEEIDSTHPFYSTLSDIYRNPEHLLSLKIKPLNQSAVNQLVDSFFDESVEDEKGLTLYVFNQTQGNPFYAKSLVEFLYEEKSICFDENSGAWKWQIPQNPTRDIIDLFRKTLERYNPDLQKLISFAACIGNQFDLETISTISKQSVNETKNNLMPYLNDELIIKVKEITKNTPNGYNEKYQFKHDRVQQAAYLLINKRDLTKTHLKIGKLLYSNLNTDQIEDRLFEILEHLNIGRKLIDDTDLILDLIDLNIRAAKKAKSAAAYSAMLKFNRSAYYFINRVSGGLKVYLKANYQKALLLIRDLAESEFLEGSREEAEKIIENSLSYTKTSIDRAESLNVLIVHYTLLARYKDAINAGRQALAEFGVVLPENDFEKFRNVEIQQINKKLSDKNISNLLKSSIMTDPEKLMVTKLLITLGPPCYRTHQFLWSVIVPKVVNLTLSYGLVPQIGYSHTAFGGLLGWVNNDYKNAKEFGDLAEKVMEQKFGSPMDQSVFYLMIGSSTRHWFKHLKYSSQDYVKAYQIGQKSGNLQYAAYAFGHNMYCRFFQGIELDEMIQDTKQSLVFSKTRLNHWAIDLLQGGITIFEALTNVHQSDLNKKINDVEYLKRVESNKNIQVLCIYNIFKSLYQLTIGDLDGAMVSSDKAEELIFTVGTQGLLPWPEHKFVRFLILTALCTDNKGKQYDRWKSELEQIKEHLEIWNKYSPENYSHKLYLAEAEIHRLEDKPGKALLYYDQAIKIAKQNRFVQWEAVANERACNFWESQGNGFMAQVYWQRAHTCYTLWGASIKLKLLEDQFADRMKFEGLTVNEFEKNNLTQREQQDFIQNHIHRIRQQSDNRIALANQSNLSKEADTLAKALERLRLETAEREKAQVQLVEKEKALRLSLDAAKAGTWTWNIITGEVIWDDRMQSIFGIKPGTFDGTFDAWKKRVHPDDLQEAEKATLEALKHGNRYEHEYRVKGFSGDWRIINAQAATLKDNNGKPVQMSGFATDITESKHAEESSNRLKERLESLWNISRIADSDIKIISDHVLAEVQKMTQSQYAFYGLLNKNENEMILHAWSHETMDDCKTNEKTIHFPIDKAGLWAEAVKRKKILTINGFNLDHPGKKGLPDGHVQLTRLMVVPYIKDDKVISIVAVANKEAQYSGDDEKQVLAFMRNVQLLIDRKNAEQEAAILATQLQQMQKIESIGNLAGGIAHDFNNILFPIVGMSEMLIEDLPKGSEEYESAQEILMAGKRGSELVNQILSFSRQHEHKLIPTRIEKILREVIKLSRSTIPTNIEIKQNIQQNCGMVMADSTQVHQIAMNLITNAFHAVEDKNGIIEIEFKELDINNEELPDRLLQLGRYVKLSISDNGIGMPQNVTNKIFEPYFTTKEKGKGTGLGLAVVYGIVKEHKGDIKVNSEVGKGTTFNIYLPLMKKTTEAVSAGQTSKLETGTERILLVDDEEPIVRLEKAMLKRLGYQVKAYSNCKDAFDVFKTDPGKYDLVITDMTMPNMTGDKLAKEILVIRPDIPIIICTGFSERVNNKQIEAIGVKGFLMKPVVKSEMAQMVRKVLDDIKIL